MSDIHHSFERKYRLTYSAFCIPKFGIGQRRFMRTSQRRWPAKHYVMHHFNCACHQKITQSRCYLVFVREIEANVLTLTLQNSSRHWRWNCAAPPQCRGGSCSTNTGYAGRPWKPGSLLRTGPRTSKCPARNNNDTRACAFLSLEVVGEGMNNPHIQQLRLELATRNQWIQCFLQLLFNMLWKCESLVFSFDFALFEK